MANDHNYEVFAPEHGVPIKAWTRGVPVEDAAKQQLLNIATLPFIYRWIAVMPDVHLGKGATVAARLGKRRRGQQEREEGEAVHERSLALPIT